MAEWARCYLASGALGMPMAQSGDPPVGRRQKSMGPNTEADSRRHFPSDLFVYFPFLSFPQLLQSLLRDSNGSLQLQNMWPRRPPTHCLHLPPPLLERLCCPAAGPATATSATSSYTTTPTVPLPPSWFIPPTFGCTDVWTSWVTWYAVKRHLFFFFFLVMDVQL